MEKKRLNHHMILIRIIEWEFSFDGVDILVYLHYCVLVENSEVLSGSRRNGSFAASLSLMMTHAEGRDYVADKNNDKREVFGLLPAALINWSFRRAALREKLVSACSPAYIVQNFLSCMSKELNMGRKKKREKGKLSLELSMAF
jgi:hypothetical protein